MARQDLAFEHQVLAVLKRSKALPRRWLLAVSGGADSMALAEFSRKWQRGLGVELTVAHVHHGGESAYRAEAQSLVGEWARQAKIPFVTNPIAKDSPRGEASLRELREAWLERWRVELGMDVIVYAHHATDLLETRMLRLMRGTGPEGLKAMAVRRGRKLRPFLGVSSEAVRGYAQARGLKWVEDPSNLNTDHLRNWLRHDWLPRLEARRPGSISALSRSLSLLARTAQVPEVDVHVGLRRDLMKAASFRDREALVTGYLRALGVRDYARSHVHEILKRIDTRQKHLRFETLGLAFEVTPDFIRASRV